MRSIWRSVLSVGMLCGIVSTAEAQEELYNHLGYFSPSNAWNLTDARSAMNFTLDQSAVVSDAQIWTTYQGGGVVDPAFGFRGQFDWTIFTDTEGLPGSVVSSGSSIPTRLSQSLYGPDFDLSLWDFAITPTELVGGQRYWLSLQNTDSTHSYSENNGFYWVAASNITGTVPGILQFDGTGPWIEDQVVDMANVGYGNRPSLALYGTTTTPEPSTMLLLGTGLLGVIPIIRRRTR